MCADFDSREEFCLLILILGKNFVIKALFWTLEINLNFDLFKFQLHYLNSKLIYKWSAYTVNLNFNSYVRFDFKELKDLKNSAFKLS